MSKGTATLPDDDGRGGSCSTALKNAGNKISDRALCNMWRFPRQKGIRRKHILGCGERFEREQSSNVTSSPLNGRDATGLPSTSSGGVIMGYRLRHPCIQRTTESSLLPIDSYGVSSSSSSTGPCPQKFPTAERHEPTTTATMWGASVRRPASIRHLQGKGILGSHPRDTQKGKGILGSHPRDTQNFSHLSFDDHRGRKCCFSLLTSSSCDAGEALTAELWSTQKVINSLTLKEEGHHRNLAIGKSVSPMPDYPPICLASAVPVPSSSPNMVVLPSKPSLYNRAGRAYQRNGRCFQTRGWNGIQTDGKRRRMGKDGATSMSSFQNVYI